MSMQVWWKSCWPEKQTKDGGSAGAGRKTAGATTHIEVDCRAL